MTSAAYLSLYIREGLPPFITEVQLSQHAAKLQQSDIIIDVAVRKIHVTGHCVGYAYITCSSPVVVQKTASTMNNTTIAAGYKLKVLYSTKSTVTTVTVYHQIGQSSRNHSSVKIETNCPRGFAQ